METERIEIERLAHGGDGVGQRTDGKTLFVPFTSPGDVVDVEIAEDRDTFARGRVTGLLTPGPSRCEPPCPYFEACGGCQWQHVTRDAQLAAKTASVTDALERISHMSSQGLVDACASPSAEYGYRNKVELRVADTPTGLELGFSKTGSDEIVPVAECLLMPEAHRSLLRSLRGALRYLSSRESVRCTRVSIRMAHHTRDVQVALWTRPEPFPRALVARTLSEATSASSIVRVISRDGTDPRDVSSVERLHGKSWWAERCAGYRFGTSAPSFFQVNTAGAEHLVELVLASIGTATTAADLYSGVGTFTLPLAASLDHVTAIEASKWALADLRHNLERAQLDADVHGGDASYEAGDLAHHDVLVLDPPRTGLGTGVLESLSTLEPERIIYVSCDPATFARDARRIVDRGYTLANVAPVDLFPQTFHVEVVGVFEA